ncbi:hypothetical protein GQ457_14G014060 [Hibiscus cannabinus]
MAPNGYKLIPKLHNGYNSLRAYKKDLQTSLKMRDHQEKQIQGTTTRTENVDAKCKGWKESLGDVEDAGNDRNGGKAESGPGAMKSSGFGGLGVEGMVGMDVPVVGTIPPGDGNKGATSGDSGRKGDNEGSEMVGVSELS